MMMIKHITVKGTINDASIVIYAGIPLFFIYTSPSSLKPPLRSIPDQPIHIPNSIPIVKKGIKGIL